MEGFYKWYKDENHVTCDPHVVLSKSNLTDPSSGYGLYASSEITNNNNTVQYETQDNNVLLRVPQKSTFDIHTINSILHETAEYSSADNSERTITKTKEVFKHLIENPQTESIISESIIITFYFMLFHFLKDTHEIPSKFQRYLDDVLLKTEINNPITKNLDYLEVYSHYPALLANELVVRYFLTFFKNELGINPTESEGAVRQLYAAIISRTLEIPQEISEDSSDFTTSTTLVPILDFINHSSTNPWCAFDVDRKSSDVILKYKTWEQFEGYKQNRELFIQYSDIIEFTSFNFTYGFVPTIDDTAISYFNLSLQRDLLDGNILLFYKWFNINPVIQFYKEGVAGKWKINSSHDNFIQLILPFIHDSNLTGEKSWLFNPDTYHTFANFHSKLNPEEDLKDLVALYRNEIRRGENSGRDIMYFPQLAWTLQFKDDGNDETLKKRVMLPEAVEYLKSLSDEDIAETCLLFKKFLEKYASSRETIISKSINNVVQLDNTKSQDELQSFVDICNIEKHVLKDIHKMQVKDVLEDTTKLLDDIPIPPPINLLLDDKEPNKISETNNEQDYTSTDEQYEETKFTDFLDEEYHMLSAFFGQ